MSTDPIDLSATDGQLLARFAQGGEQAPFELLVRRHGSLVLGVCRAVLGGAGSQHDAEDAAQATFLTLARKSRSLGGYDSVAGWLYRVAWHIAKRTRSARELRSRRERDAAAQRAVHVARQAHNSAATAGDPREPMLEALHEELNKLPEKYRLPLILHHLEGWTEPEIAALLGCRVGTLSGRLSRARQMLRDRIARHGKGLAAFSVAGLSAALAEQANASASALGAAMQQHLLAPMKSVLHVGAGSGVSAQAATLAQGALEMLARRFALMLATYATSAAVLLLGEAIVFQAVRSSPRQQHAVRAAFPMTNPADPTGDLLPQVPRPRQTSPRAGAGRALESVTTLSTGEVSGKIIAPDDQPIAGGTVRIYASRSAFERGEKELRATASDAKGAFRLTDVPAGTNLFLVCISTKPALLNAHSTIPEVSEDKRTELDVIRLHKGQ